MRLRGIVLVVVGLALASLVVLGASEPRYGGTFRCAIASEPGTLDMQMSTGVNEGTIACNVFQGLFSFDADFAPQPELATGLDLNPSGTVATIHLRQGVFFHSGQEMKAEDVVASLTRWGQYGATAKALWSLVTAVDALDEYTVVLTLSQPFGPLTTYLANDVGGPFIYPKALVEAAGNKPLPPSSYIGTGPYRFVEWKSGDYILLERYDRFASLDTPSSGHAGKKTAYFDKLQFFFVPDDNARLVGIQAGTYDYVVDIPNDLLASVEGDKNVLPIIINHPPIYPIALVNNKQGICTNVGIKRAMLTALDMDEIMLAGYGDAEFWSLNASYFAPGIRWYTPDEGLGLYDVADPAKARTMAQEAGYKGEPIRIIVAGDMTAQYNQAVVVTSHLVAAGFNVSLQVYDKATFMARRNAKDNPEWELAFSFYSTTPDPSLVLMLSPTYAGWWDSPRIQVLRTEVNQLTDFAARYAKWQEIMDLWYEEIPALKFGDAFQLHLIRSDVGGGYGTSEHVVMIHGYFYNLWGS